MCFKTHRSKWSQHNPSTGHNNYACSTPPKLFYPPFHSPKVVLLHLLLSPMVCFPILPLTHCCSDPPYTVRSPTVVLTHLPLPHGCFPIGSMFFLSPSISLYTLPLTHGCSMFYPPSLSPTVVVPIHLTITVFPIY